jgi:hypothetical protein
MCAFRGADTPTAIEKDNCRMTKLLERALAEVRKLPDERQDAIAAIILDEIVDEKLWDEQFGQSQDELARLALRAREDIRTGRVRNAGIDEL